MPQEPDFCVVGRDPFAREDRIRRSVETSGGCAWCGNRRRSGRLFQYGVWRDGVTTRPEWSEGYFCSAACHDAYHGH